MEPLTKVIFRRFKDGKVIALFPELPGTNNWARDCLSYVHLGQHGTASVSLTLDTAPASQSEYASLAAELKWIGYRLKIARRFSVADAYKRRKALEA